jgi:hypothetical protein
LGEKRLDRGSTKEPASMVIRAGALAMIAYESPRLVERNVVSFVPGKGHENTLACGVRDGSSTTVRRRSVTRSNE